MSGTNKELMLDGYRRIREILDRYNVPEPERGEVLDTYRGTCLDWAETLGCALIEEETLREQAPEAYKQVLEHISPERIAERIRTLTPDWTEWDG